MKKLKIVMVLLVCAIIFQNCKQDSIVNPYPDPTPYTLANPEHFPILKISGDNPMTVEGIALGRRLYYDPILDKDSARACADCHHMATSFTTPGANALAHVNLAWNTAFLWNGKVEGTLEDIMLFEVNDFFQADLERLRRSEVIKDMFGAAFGDNTITSEKAAKALAQFARILVSAESKYDKMIRPGSWVEPTDEEFRGYQIFFSEKGDCFHCHGNPLFTDGLFHNNGLNATPDAARSFVTGNSNDVGKYKTPTLRNIELTTPYMHDGRFQTLEEVVDFYSEGVKNSPTIDPLMKAVDRGGLQLTPAEKSDLIAFLKTLTDTTFTTNTALSSPF